MRDEHHSCKRCATTDRVTALAGAAILGASLGGWTGAVAVSLFAIVLFWVLDRRNR